MIKICPKHGCEKVWVKDLSRKSGGFQRCPECHCENNRRYRKGHPEKMGEGDRERKLRFREAHPEKCRERSRRQYEVSSDKINAKHRSYREAHPDKIKAHRAVHAAIGKGDIIRDNTCWLCSEQHERTDFHHAWGYSPENWLRVVEVCRPCHSELEGLSVEQFDELHHSIENPTWRRWEPSEELTQKLEEVANGL